MAMKLGDAAFFFLLTTKFSWEGRVARQLSQHFFKEAILDRRYPRVKVRKVEDGEILVQKFCDSK